MEDSERNNGEDRPYFMDPSLLKLMNLHNEKRSPSPSTEHHGSEEAALVE